MLTTCYYPSARDTVLASFSCMAAEAFSGGAGNMVSYSRGSVLACSAAVLLVLSACSSGSDDGDQGESDNADQSDQQPSTPDNGWFVVVEYRTGDGGGDQLHYMFYEPESGETTVSPLEPIDSDDDPWESDPLAVSADYQRTLQDTILSAEQRNSGIIPIQPLNDDGSREDIDLRDITGDMRLEPLKAIFDGTDPNVLHVGAQDGSVWEIDIAASSGTKTDTVISDPGSVVDPDARPTDRDSRQYNWQFADDASGAIVERESLDDEFSDDTHLPNAEPLDRDSQGELPELPGSPDQAVRTDDGTVWAFDVESTDPRTVRAYRFEEGADDWERLEPSAVLPGTDDHRVRVVGPPLD